MVLPRNTVSVYCSVMKTFQTALAAYLKRDENAESALASAIGRSQAAVNRYRNGNRFPDAQTARLIETKTGGEVPFSAWQADFLARSGISQPTSPTEKAAAA